MIAMAIFLLLAWTALSQNARQPVRSLVFFGMSCAAILWLFFHHSSLHLAISL
ncbi:MAG: hypothetical protein P8M78_05460 [Myxococcota bacterium]|nr:hypothetical protein [Myxococcota bacterium]